MKKLAGLCLLFLFVLVVSVQAQESKDSLKIKSLVKEINESLDSISKTPNFIVDEGHKYYRFNSGVFTSLSDSIFIGSFLGLENVHFVSSCGKESFVFIHEKGEKEETTLEELLFLLTSL